MALEVKGTLLEIHEVQHVNDSFQKREFVLDIVNGKYSDQVLMQTVQDKTALLDHHQVGDVVTVAFNLRGRPSEKHGVKKFFANVEAWRIEAS